jgi:hypothetical protein
MTTTSQLGYLLTRPSLPVGMPDESGTPPALAFESQQNGVFQPVWPHLNDTGGPSQRIGTWLLGSAGWLLGDMIPASSTVSGAYHDKRKHRAG